MKYLLPLVMLATAAWAIRGEPHGTFARTLAQASEPRSQPEVPWLNEELAGEFSAIVESDPHQGLYDADEPQAGYEGDDPHAGARVVLGAQLPEQGVARSAAKNGHTIAELYSQRSALAERAVRVRGVVVKRTDGILGESYVHLQDGSGSAAHQDNDLTITTTEELALGETVEVEGIVQVDRDLGLGYRYAVMLTGATQARLQ